MKGLENFWAKKQGKIIGKGEISEGIDEHYGINKEQQREDEPEDDRDNYEEDESHYEELPKGLIDAKDFIEKNGWEITEEIYRWYKNAMERKLESHGRVALEEDRFIYHFFEGGNYDRSIMYGDLEKGFLLGGLKYGVFTPTHFAPKSLRKGYELMKQLGSDKNVAAALAITEDLIDTIKKMPEWKILDTSFISQLRNQPIEKQIAHNDHPNIQQLMYGLMYEYFEEHSRENSKND